MSSPPPHSPKVEFKATRGFPGWLAERNASLALTTYQSGMLLLIGVGPNGEMSYFNRAVPRCMGVAAGERTLWIGSMYQVWRFENTLLPGQTHQGYDAYYLPRTSWTTGDIDIHDLGVDAAGRPVFVNTLYSCLATVSERHSFRALWRPPFISRLAAEDRCHLNGLAMVDGEPRYVTCVSRSDAPGGWRDFRASGGLLLHVPSGEVVCAGLSMPHSPRWHDGRLWLLNSGTGEFGYVDLAAGRFEPVAFCPGYLRGLSFVDGYAVLGLSMGRESAFAGLPLKENLERKGALARCAVQVVALEQGDVRHEIRIVGDIQELYDVSAIAGVRLPGTLGFMSEEILHRITFEEAAE